MPLYAYRCTQCGHRFEKIQHFSDAEDLECPKCRGLLERPLTAPTLNFKGAGWYVNDYASSSSASESTSTSDAATKPAASDTKSPSTSSDSASSASASTPAPATSSTPSSGTPSSTT